MVVDHRLQTLIGLIRLLVANGPTHAETLRSQVLHKWALVLRLGSSLRCPVRLAIEIFHSIDAEVKIVVYTSFKRTFEFRQHQLDPEMVELGDNMS